MNIREQIAWTDERVAHLKGLVDDRLSASQIAKEMGGISRNAVLGKLHRMGMGLNTHRPKPVRSKPPRPQRKNRRVRIHLGGGRAFKGEVEIVDEPQPVELPPDTSPFACTIMDLSTGMCRYPMGEPAHDMPYCGAPCEGSWCERHRRIVFQPAGRRG